MCEIANRESQHLSFRVPRCYGISIIISATVLLKTVVGVLPWSIILSAPVFIASTVLFGWYTILTHEDKRIVLQTVKRV